MHKINPLAASIHHATQRVAPTGVVTMATEGHTSDFVKDVLKLIGLTILGASVSFAVGYILNSLFSSSRRKTHLTTKYSSLMDSKETTVNRARLVQTLKDQNAHVNYLLVECVNEGKLWDEAASLISTSWFKMTEKHSVLDATLEMDKLYSSRDDKTFVNRAEKLAKELVGSSNWIIGELQPLGRAVNEAGKKVDMSYATSRLDTPEQIRPVIEGLRSLHDAFIELAGEQKDTTYLSTKGEFKLKHHLDGVKKIFEEIDQEEKSVNKNIKELQRQNLDEEQIKTFLNSTPEIKAANEKLIACVQLLAIATKIRAVVRSAVTHTLNIMAGALNGALSPEYKQSGSAVNRIGTEGLTMATESLEEIYDFPVVTPMHQEQTPAEHKLLCENTLVVSTLLDIGTLAIRAAGIQAELGGDQADKFKDSDVTALLAARFTNAKKI